MLAHVGRCKREGLLAMPMAESGALMAKGAHASEWPSLGGGRLRGWEIRSWLPGLLDREAEGSMGC
eukprot:5728446-Prorocentrum_lima.AAC.1